MDSRVVHFGCDLSSGLVLKGRSPYGVRNALFWIPEPLILVTNYYSRSHGSLPIIDNPCFDSTSEAPSQTATAHHTGSKAEEKTQEEEEEQHEKRKRKRERKRKRKRKREEEEEASNRGLDLAPDEDFYKKARVPPHQSSLKMHRSSCN